MPVHPHTTQLQYDADGTPPFTAVADVVGITPPKMTKGDSKVTLLNAAAKVHSYIAGWRESGEIEATLFFEKAGFNTLLGFYNSDTVYYWRILFPLISGESTNSHLAFQGYVKGIEPGEVNTDSDDPVEYKVVIKVTGAVTFTAGS
jgi:hypothetical protein